MVGLALRENVVASLFYRDPYSLPLLRRLVEVVTTASIDADVVKRIVRSLVEVRVQVPLVQIFAGLVLSHASRYVSIQLG